MVGPGPWASLGLVTFEFASAFDHFIFMLPEVPRSWKFVFYHQKHRFRRSTRGNNHIGSQKILTSVTYFDKIVKNHEIYWFWWLGPDLEPHWVWSSSSLLQRLIILFSSFLRCYGVGNLFFIIRNIVSGVVPEEITISDRKRYSQVPYILTKSWKPRNPLILMRKLVLDWEAEFAGLCV